MLVLAFKCDFCGKLYQFIQQVATLPSMFTPEGELIVMHTDFRDGNTCSASCRIRIENGL